MSPIDLRVEIASAVLAELEHFEQNFKIEISPADVYRHLLFESQTILKGEPFVAYIVAEVDGEKRTYLICRNYTPMAVNPLNPNGVFVSYKAPLGAIASRRVGDEIIVRTPGGPKSITILHKDIFKPIKAELWDAVDNNLSFADKEYLIDSLRQLLRLMASPLTSPIEAGTDYTFELDGLDEVDEAPRRRLGRISQVIALRDQPILDEIQDDLFRLPISSQLIVTGAPGTGKTTVIVRRLAQKTKFDLLSEDEKQTISEGLVPILFHPHHSWLMFTPNELLKGYLKEALAKELLPANEHTVKTWDTTRTVISRDVLKILKAGSVGIFSRLKEEILSPRIRANTTTYLERFRSFFSRRAWETATEAVNQTQPLILSKAEIESLREPVFARYVSFMERLHSTVRRVTSSLENQHEQRTLTLFERLANFRPESEAIRKELELFLRGVLGTIIKDRDAMVRQLILRQQKTDPSTTRKTALRSIRDAMLWFGSSERATKTDGDKSAAATWGLVREYLSNEQELEFKALLEPSVKCLHALGILQRSLRGFGSILASIPSEYDRFRKAELTNSNNVFLTLASDAIGNRQISTTEIDLLIYVMLSEARKLFKRNSDLLYDTTNDELLESIKSQYRTQIVVDEATDFSPIQLGCMYQLSHPEFDSVALVGDLMQRVTVEGLTNWDSCNFIANFKIKALDRAYRQSPKLLSIAATLYQQAVGAEPPFSSAFEREELDPDPLIFYSDNPLSLGSWIAERILEIYQLNGFHLPSVAVFVAEDRDIDDIYDVIKGPLSGNAIEVDKCPEGRILGTDSRVRIFSVEYIKGLEFGAVFFVDIDRVHDKRPDLVDKYLYVGLTRATTFLAITCKKELPNSLSVAAGDFIESTWFNLIEPLPENN